MNHETIEYKGYEIEIHFDDFPQNPFEEWDCNAPMLTCSERNHITEYGNIPDFYLTHDEIKNNIDEVKKLFNIDRLIFIRYATHYYSTDLIDIIESAIDDLLDNSTTSEHFDALETIYTIKGYDVLNSSSSGYSQGDYADVLIIQDDNFYKTTGASKDDAEKSMQDQLDLYSAYAWGDVYGYTIEGLDDSCCGFYGDHETSGLLDDARNAIDYAVSYKQKQTRLELQLGVFY